MRLSKKSQNMPFDYEVPIINLSSFKNLNLEGLKKGLNHGFVNKHKDTRINLALELEVIAQKADEYIRNDEKGSFHEFLRKITNSLAKNVEHSKDDTFHQLKDLKANRDIAILSGNKDSNVVILDKSDYQKLVQKMIDEEIEGSKYVQAEETINKILTLFQGFLLRDFKNIKEYSFIRPSTS